MQHGPSFRGKLIGCKITEDRRGKPQHPALLIAYLCWTMSARYIITLKDPAQKAFWEDLLAHLDFIEVEAVDGRMAEENALKEFESGLRSAMKEVKEDISGNKKLTSARDFLNELRS
jgi:hypothetical protein